MAIKIGNTEITEISKIKLGNTDIKEVWVGNIKVWPATSSMTYLMSYYNANSSSGTIGLYISDSSGTIIWYISTGETSSPLSGSVPESIVEQIKNGGYNMRYSVGGTFDELNLYIDGSYHSTKGTDTSSYNVVVGIPAFTTRYTSFEVSTPGF